MQSPEEAHEPTSLRILAGKGFPMNMDMAGFDAHAFFARLNPAWDTVQKPQNRPMRGAADAFGFHALPPYLWELYT